MNGWIVFFGARCGVAASPNVTLRADNLRNTKLFVSLVSEREVLSSTDFSWLLVAMRPN